MKVASVQGLEQIQTFRTRHWVVAARMGVGTVSMGAGIQPGIASFSDACLNYFWQ